MNEERGAGGKSYPTPRFPVGRQPDTDASDLGRELMRRLFENGRGVLVFRTQLREAPTHAVCLWVLLRLFGDSAGRVHLLAHTVDDLVRFQLGGDRGCAASACAGRAVPKDAGLEGLEGRQERRGGRGTGWTPAADRRDGVSRAKAAGLIEWPCGCSRRTTHEERRRWSPAARGVATRVQRRPSVR